MTSEDTRLASRLFVACVSFLRVEEELVDICAQLRPSRASSPSQQCLSVLVFAPLRADLSVLTSGGLDTPCAWPGNLGLLFLTREWGILDKEEVDSQQPKEGRASEGKDDLKSQGTTGNSNLILRPGTKLTACCRP